VEHYDDEMSAESEFYKELGERVQRARRKIGLSQEAVAEKVFLNRTSIVNIEKGRQKMLAHTLVAMAQALHVSPVDLLPRMKEDSQIDELLRTRSEPTQAFVRGVLASIETTRMDHVDPEKVDPKARRRTSRKGRSH